MNVRGGGLIGGLNRAELVISDDRAAGLIERITMQRTDFELM